MRDRGRRAALAGIVASLLAFGALIALAPPAAVRLIQPRDPREMIGSLHVHTVRSDGTGTVDQVAADAADAGLQFVVLTDHGDGTRAPDPPHYRAGVLCIDAVEISTTAGHYVAIGLAGAAPYRLGGEPRDVVEDVARLGGFGIAAHPDSEKPELRWRDWSLAFDGLEWLNADSEWRDERLSGIARAFATYFLRPPEVIASLFDRPAGVLRRWDVLSRRRRLIAVAGHDAHARMGLRGNWEPTVGEWSVRLPSYAAAFRAFTQRVRLERPPTGDADEDARALLAAIRAGHTYTVIDAFARPASLSFEARSDSAAALGGDDIVSAGPVHLAAQVSEAPGASLALYRNGRLVTMQEGVTLTHTHVPSPAIAVYRVEASLRSAAGTGSTPWVVSNPIWIGHSLERTPLRVEPAVAVESRAFFAGRPPSWRLEHDRRTVAAVDATPAQGGVARTRLMYELSSREEDSPYAAAVAVVDTGRFTGWDRIRFRGAASPEMRISVQVREPKSGRRWKRSVVLFPQAREVTIRFADMSFAEPVLAGRPPREELDSLLFVVDTTNARAGARGTVWLEDVRLEREQSPR